MRVQFDVTAVVQHDHLHPAASSRARGTRKAGGQQASGAQGVAEVGFEEFADEQLTLVEFGTVGDSTQQRPSLFVEAVQLSVALVESGRRSCRGCDAKSRLLSELKDGSAERADGEGEERGHQ